jgi:hypothetical protein
MAEPVHAELGTRLVFVGSTKGEHLTLEVDQNPPVVGQLVSSGGLSRLTTELSLSLTTSQATVRSPRQGHCRLAIPLSWREP